MKKRLWRLFLVLLFLMILWAIGVAIQDLQLWIETALETIGRPAGTIK